MSDEIHEEVRDANRSLRELGVSCDWQGKIDRAAKLWSDMKREQQKAEVEAEAKNDMTYHASEIHQDLQDRARQMYEALAHSKRREKIAEIFDRPPIGCDMTQELSRLREHSSMLGQIAGLVAEFCEADTTTLDGVKLMKAELYALRAEQLKREAGWE